MKIKLDLNSDDLRELNDPETSQQVINEARNMLDEIFENRDQLIKCSIVLDNKDRD